MTDHPVKVPPKLVGDWLTEAADLHLLTPTNLDYLANRAAQWAADQELEACREWLRARGVTLQIIEQLRAAMRPKPPTLAEQATTALHAIASGANDAREQCQDIATLTAALTRLAELEAQQ